MIEIVSRLMSLMETPTATLTSHHLTSWPAEERNALEQAGLLIETELATHVLCPECHGHFEEALTCETPTRNGYSFIYCPEVGRVWIPREYRRQWQVDFARFASMLFADLDLSGRVVDLIPQRLWRLGKSVFSGSSREWLLARGLHWSDRDSVLSAIGKCRQPILFTPIRRDPSPSMTTSFPVANLEDLLFWKNDQLEIDRISLWQLIQESDAEVASTESTMTQLKLLIRQQIKAETKTELTDDLFLAAYRETGSYREAAKLLSERTGKSVTKDQISRAVQRAGGLSEVIQDEDSDSIVRSNASQRRDRKGKKVIQSQTDTE